MHSDMSKETKDQILVRLRRRYATAGVEHKGKLLDQAIELLGYHRKAAMRAAPGRAQSSGPEGKPGAGAPKDLSPREASADFEADLVYSLSAVWEPVTCALAGMVAGL